MKVLECLLCSKMYDLEDARKGNYFVQTRICASCYGKGREADVTIWCFGKKEVFSLARIECSKLCPDREICKYVVSKKRS